MTRRWLVFLPSVIATVAIGVGTWQIIATRSELHTAQRQLAALGKADALKLAVEKAKAASAASALASEQRTVNSLLNTTTTTTQRVAPFAFVDVTTLTADLDQAFSQATGFLPSQMNPAFLAQFISKFTAEEQQQTALAEEGRPYYVPDPVAEANAYVASAPSS